MAALQNSAMEKAAPVGELEPRPGGRAQERCCEDYLEVEQDLASFLESSVQR